MTIWLLQNGSHESSFASHLRHGVLGICLLALCALAMGARADGHSGAPFWSRAQAESRVLLGPINLNGREVRVSEVACFGAGKIRLRVRGVLKFQHFDCLVTPSRERRFWIRLHPQKRSWTFAFLHFA